jgi:putative transposase
MSNRRIRGEGGAHYHCMSRVVGGERLLGEREKGVLSGLLWRAAEFSGVQVLSYAVMSNHFHVLVSVPEADMVPDEELVRRYGVLYGENRSPWHPKPEVLAGLLEANDTEGQSWRRRLSARMGDVSAFMKTVKQRFALWYNQSHGRFGAFWAERFKSVLLEGNAHTLATVAAYIDLNPVRAGLVEDPGLYRWSGYGEAMGGKRRARAGLRGIFGEEEATDWGDVVARYRRLLFGKGAGGASTVAKIPRERVLKVLEAGGKVARGEALQCRVRYFTDGAVLGSAAFVEGWLKTRGPDRRRKGAPTPQPLEGSDWEGLTVARGLRRRLYG